MRVLTLNAGSSSLKFALFEGAQAVLRGGFDSVTDAPRAHAAGADGAALEPPAVDGVGHEAVLPALFAWVRAHDGGPVQAVGHRIVHGGDRAGAALADDAVLAELAMLSPLAPLHQPHGLAVIRAARAAEPGLPQVACFDTAFHQTMPEVARRLPLPGRLGLRRYGFHGLSYEWIAGRLPPRLASGRTVAAHLGSGASLCALQAGVSIETTMSMTPLDGLMMGTRCGRLDPGVVLYLMQARGMGVGEVEHLLYYESGLLGVSGVSGDVQALHEHGGADAAAALELFAYRIAQGVGAMAAALGGVDGLVFTGGIGEHDPAMRAAVCARLGWLALTVEPGRTGPGRVGGTGAEVWVIPTDEEAVIARQTAGVCGSQKPAADR